MGRKKVLITGAAGRIGSTLWAGLKDRYDLRLMFHRKVLPTEDGEEVVIGSVSDLDKMEEAVDGVDAVVHMAGFPSSRWPFEEVLDANIRGTYCVYEACRRKGVNRVVFASTNHVTGNYEKDGIYTTPDMPVRPDSHYGVSKACGEAMGRYYSDRFGISVICLRIGTFQSPEVLKGRLEEGLTRILSSWLSHRDTVQLVWRGIEAEQVKFGIYYGISNNTRAYWDTQNAREELGYAPEDNAEDHL